MVYFGYLTHAYHKNICRGTSQWGDTGEQRTRDFETPEEMTRTIVNTFNKYVKADDELWHLGDWSFAGVENILKFRAQLHCQNIHLVFGNHDQHIESGKYFTYMHKDDGITSKNLITGQKDCFSTTQYVKTLNINGEKVFLSHYSHQVWDKSHKGQIHLFGHSHDTLKGISKSMDVGIDVAFRMFGEYRPFLWTEIQSIMAKKEIQLVDHHTSLTN